MPPVSNIVVFLPNWVGDVVMATPAIRALRRHFGRAHMALFGRAASLETLSGIDWADEFIVDACFGQSKGRGFLATLRRLRSRRFEMGVLLPNSFRTALLARLAGIERIAGYDRDGRGWMLTDKIPPPRKANGCFEPISAIDYYLALAELLAARSSDRRMELAVKVCDQEAADVLLEQAGVDAAKPLVVLNPGASFGSSKMWSPQCFAAVADELARRRGAQIVVNAAPSERAIAAAVGAAMVGKPSVNLADRDSTIGLLKGLMRRCSLLITNDTGARHIAAAFGVGVVTIFGSTDPRWARIDYPLERVVRANVPCSPCQRKICPKPPGGEHHQCMRAVTPQMVLDAADELLERTPSAAEPTS